MQKEGIIAYIKRLITGSGIVGKIIAINVAVFLFFMLIQLIEKLYVKDGLTEGVLSYFTANSDFSVLIYRPWTLITYFFSHYEFFHLAMNMLVLFFTGRMFVQFFGARRLLATFFLGGITAYFVHVLGYSFFPMSNGGGGGLIGASGSVMAVFFAVAVYRPNLKVQLFGVFPVSLIILAGIYLLSDLMQIGKDDGIGHLAHLGGAIFGAISVINANSPKNIMNQLDRFIFKWKLSGVSTKKKKPKMKVYKSTATKTSRMTDEEYNSNKSVNQERINDILDKISKKGYEGLTKEEKDILFNESKR